MWLVDLERSCTLFMGQCLGGMLIGEPTQKSEQLCQNWLNRGLFLHGLENNETDYLYIKNLTSYIMTNDKEKLNILISKSNREVQKYCKLILKYTNLGTEESTSEDFQDLIEQLLTENSEGVEDLDEPVLKIIMRIFLYTLLKHTGLLLKNSHQYLQEIYTYVNLLTRKILTMKNPIYNSSHEIKGRSEQMEIESDLDASESTILPQKELDFEETCSIVLERSLYLLICVKGPEQYTEENISDDDETEKPYVEFYQTNSKQYKNLKNLCSLAVNFVCDEPYEKNFKKTESWSTDLEIIQDALELHTSRAEMRLTSLIQIYILLSSHKNTSTILTNCLHQQLLCGCFGLINVKTNDSCTQLHHYSEGIQAAPFHLQLKIKEIVHDIYNILISSLKENLQLQLLTVFVLSTRYKSEDLSLVIKNGLLNILVDISKKNTCYVIPSSLANGKIPSQAVACLRLLNILAMSVSIHAKQLDSIVIDGMMDILHEQLNCLLDQILTSKISDCKILSYERNLGDFLVFIHHLASSKIIKNTLCSKKWTSSLLSVTGNEENSLNLKVHSLRPKLLALQLLGSILPSTKHDFIDVEQRETIVQEIFSQVSNL